MRQAAEERACAGCGRPLPVQERGHGRPIQYCTECRERRRKLSQANNRASHQIKPPRTKGQAAFASEQIAQAGQAFAQLPGVAQAMLCHWISCAIAPADDLEPRDAAHLARDFSSEVCLVSLAAFCGALLDSGYEPTLTSDGRWLFAIRRGNDAAFPDEPLWRYTIGHPTPRFHQLMLQLEEYISLFGPLTTEDVADEEGLEDVGE